MSSKQPPDNLFDRIFKPVLLRSESPRSFKMFRNEIYSDFAPQSPIERLLARQIVNALWQVERLQSLGAGILNNVTLPAIQNLIEPTSFLGIDTDHLVKEFFSNGESNRKVLQRLNQLGMDEVDIQAESFRIRAEELQAQSRLLAAAQSTAIKLIRALEERRSRARSQPKKPDDGERDAGINQN